MKLNWGHKLLFFSTLFLLLIMGFVYVMIRQSVELVEQDYYEKGMKYQQVINSKKDSEKILQVKLTTNDSGQKGLSLTIIDSSLTINGEIAFYRPSDKSKDFVIPFSVTCSLPVFYPLNLIDKGVWKIKL